MSSLRVVWILLLAVVLPSAITPPAAGRYPRIFTGDFDMARASALERNAVIVIGVIQEGEETNELFRTQVWQKPAFAEATRDTITMLVNDGKHPVTRITEEKEDGEKVTREVCSHYHTDSCQVHKRLWNVCYQEFNTDGDMRTPQLIVLSPDGSEFGRLIDDQNLKYNVATIQDAQKKAGPSLSVKGLGLVKENRKVAMSHAEAGRHGAAWHSWQAVLAQTQASKWADEAREGAAAAEKGYDADVEDAQARLEQGDVIDGWSRLVAIGEAWAGSPKEKAHKKLVKKVEKDKRYKKVLEAHKKEVEAAAMWAEIEKLLRADDEKAAVKIARKLLRKYGETAAAEKARKEFPELVSGG